MSWVQEHLDFFPINPWHNFADKTIPLERSLFPLQKQRSEYRLLQVWRGGHSKFFGTTSWDSSFSCHTTIPWRSQVIEWVENKSLFFPYLPWIHLDLAILLIISLAISFIFSYAKANFVPCLSQSFLVVLDNCFRARMEHFYFSVRKKGWVSHLRLARPGNKTTQKLQSSILLL